VSDHDRRKLEQNDTGELCYQTLAFYIMSIGFSKNDNLQIVLTNLIDYLYEISETANNLLKPKTKEL